MSSHRPRLSPPRGYKDQRASTGTVYVTSYDTLASTQPGRSTVSNISRPQSISYEAQPIRKSTHHDGKTSKTEYVVRPRTNSAVTQENRKPLTISTNSASPPRRTSTLVASPREMSSALVPRGEDSRYLQPVSSLANQQSRYHPRHNSVSRMETDRYDDRGAREKIYHARGPSLQESQKQYHSSRSQPARYQDDEAWSYTGPREQFDRDYPQRPRRGSQTRQERPAGVYDQERALVRKEHGPPPASARHFDRYERDDYARHGSRSGFESDPDRASDMPRRRQSTRGPVLHQQQHRAIHDDDGYSSAREMYEPTRRHSRVPDDRYANDYERKERHKDSDRHRDRDRRDYDREYERERPRDHDRHRHKPRSRDPSPERTSFKTLAAGALGSLATAGTLNFLGREFTKDKDKEKEAESDSGEKREHRHRRHRRHKKDEDQTDQSETEDGRQKDEPRRSRRAEESANESLEEQSSKRRHSRRRSKRNDEAEDEPSPRSQSKVRTRDVSQSDTERVPRGPVPGYEQEPTSQSLEQRTISPGENEDDRPRKVQLVEPIEKKDELKPRGILKPARQVPFPEDPNPIREGVAPLKDASKDGIPPNARWTKINRVLVNPEALERAHERFEEREDYVIVLRVLSREEIEKLAEKTKKIRAERELEWQRKADERKQREQENNERQHDDYTDDDPENDAENQPQLAIEPAPAQPPLDLRNLQNQNQYYNQNAQVPQLQPLPVRQPPSQMQMPLQNQMPGQIPGQAP